MAHERLEEAEYNPLETSCRFHSTPLSLRGAPAATKVMTPHGIGSTISGKFGRGFEFSGGTTWCLFGQKETKVPNQHMPSLRR